ncbi:NAD(P)/FAD-dependent oxidoreductase [Akkermansiaceae bacterium]|nr:NAD(P)/FAD-dependent oxidoreductase [Akkermansiaceae bacterium]MDB4313944.1 NAD(P)/FAD-dependent oxidoreductase [Akkermansiaceae bacterium]
MTIFSSQKHVVIIGAGFGGLACARALARKRNVKVTLVDRRNHHLFQPLLYQVATSTLTAADIARSTRSLFKEKDGVSILYDQVEDIDLDLKRLSFQSGKSLTYDSLVIATGVKTSFFGNDQWAEHVHQLKSLSDAIGIRKQVLKNLEIIDRGGVRDKESLATVVIVGGGPTGVELAGAFSDLIRRSMAKSFRNTDLSKQRIILVEAQDRLLAPFHEKQSKYTRERLEEFGVEVRTECMVQDITKNKVTLKGGETLNAGIIIWAAGVEATGITSMLGTDLTRNGQVKVAPDLSLPDHPDVFVVGDAAAVSQADGTPVPGVAPAATQEGQYVAKIILSPSSLHREPFDYFDKGSMAIVGKGAAVVDVRGWRINGILGWFIWLFIHLVFLVDFRSKVGVLINWFWAFARNKPGSRVITAASDDTVT